MLTLKSYQHAALDTLADFLRQAQLVGVARAFRSITGRGYGDEVFSDVPCVCLRIPTGGGKTLLASHAIALLAQHWRRTDAPVALWLVPSDAIRSQTLLALQTPAHPYRQALEAGYGGDLIVCSLDELAQIAPSDWGKKTIVLVATIQSFRIEETGARNVYRFSESFERHFKAAAARPAWLAALARLNDLPDARVTEQDAAKDESGILKNHIGAPRQSLANWLALQEPILIVDEAHNTKTDKSFTTLKRLNPSAILELTATPVAGNTNVLHHVSAQELAAESMIKLPIVLQEHAKGWQSAVFAAVQQQRALEAIAMKEGAAPADSTRDSGYLRPIVLFQAQNEGDLIQNPMPPEKLREYLIDELHIPANQIAVATGKKNELDGIDIASPTCPIRFVITVQALREGWDCPFAYILCSLQKLSSATAVEQLLGRVLRMPQAKPRKRLELNRAYAHVCEAEFSKAAHALADRLINNMGFEALDLAGLVTQGRFGVFENGSENSLEGDFFNTNEPNSPVEPAGIATIFEAPASSELQDALLKMPGVEQVQVGGAAQIQVKGAIDDALAEALLQTVRGDKKKEALREQITQHNALTAAQRAPASRGAAFAPLPTLYYRRDAQASLLPLERQAVLEDWEPDLLQPAAIDVPLAQGVAEPSSFEIGMKDARISIRRADESQIVMDYASSTITAQDLVRWLDQMLYQKLSEFTQSQTQAWFAAVINRWLHEKGLTLVELAQRRFEIADALLAKAQDLREQAAQRQFRQLVLNEAWALEANWQAPHLFIPNRYAATAARRYSGRYAFEKHYYPLIDDLKETGEEFMCAQLIDKHRNVRHWIRNLDREPLGFSLPTSRYQFYPDFVVELLDGTPVVIEYKGAHLANDPHELEKRQVGQLWEKSTLRTASGGKARFAWVMKTQNGQSMAQQIDAALVAAS